MDGAEKHAAGESRAGEARDGGEAQKDFEEVIAERGYGGGSGWRRRWWRRWGGGHGCEELG